MMNEPVKCRACGKMAEPEEDDPCPSLCGDCLDREVGALEFEFEAAVEKGEIGEGDGIAFVLAKMKQIGYTKKALEDTEMMIFQGMALESLTQDDTISH